MDDRKQSFEERVQYRVAVRRFDSAFEACAQLPHEDRRLLLEEIAKRLLQQLPPASPKDQKVAKVIGIDIKQGP